MNKRSRSEASEERRSSQQSFESSDSKDQESSPQNDLTKLGAESLSEFESVSQSSLASQQTDLPPPKKLSKREEFNRMYLREQSENDQKVLKQRNEVQQSVNKIKDRILKDDYKDVRAQYEQFLKSPFLRHKRCYKLCFCIDHLKSFQLVVLIDIVQLVILPRTVMAILILCWYGRSKKHIKWYIEVRRWTWSLLLALVLAGLGYTSYLLSFNGDQPANLVAFCLVSCFGVFFLLVDLHMTRIQDYFIQIVEFEKFKEDKRRQEIREEFKIPDRLQ